MPLLIPIPRPSRRRGISLLEVLISIGILAVGLTAVLSLIPAGRSYMQKASIDDRAAVLIPNAFALVHEKGIFREGALSWQVADSGQTDDGEAFPVTRTAIGGNWSSTGQTQDTHWTIKSIDSETIEDWWPRSTPPDLQGTATGSSTVQVTTDPVTTELTGTTAPNGAWKIPLEEVLPAPDLEIETSGANVGEPKNQPYVDYAFTAKAQVSGSMRPVPVAPASYRQYGRLRKVDLRMGKARVTYELSGSPGKNETPDKAAVVDLVKIRSATVIGRNSIARSSRAGPPAGRAFSGHLWRMQVGTREGTYERFGDFPNSFPSAASWRAPIYAHVDMTANAGTTWVDGSGTPRATPNSSPEDVDWYSFPVEDDVVVKLEWSDPDGVLATDGYGSACPLYLPPSPDPIQPFRTDAGGAWYYVPRAGTASTCVKLRAVNSGDDTQIPVLQNTFRPTGEPAGSRTNPAYSITVTVARPERAIAFDPLMAARLDKVLELGGPATVRLRRERFADFQQTANGQSRSFVIPRLSLQRLAVMTVDQALSEAERLFRDEDSLAVDPPANDDDPPIPLFDRNTGGTPLRRRAAGRMSWMMLIQPQDPGPVAINWERGRMFDVSFVIFQDRKLPSPDANAALEGEYAFAGSWSDTTGMLSATVPFDLDGDGERDLVADDIRSIFRSGSWLLVAPARTSTSPAFSNTQRLDWVRIRTAELVNESQGATVRLLLETEPDKDVLMRDTLPNTALDFPVAVLAYEGVVAVVNKSLQLEP